MQRYSATSCGGGVNSSAVGGGSTRDSSRTDPSFSASSFPLNRRSLQLAPYKLKCEKEPLSGRLGPPDYYPQTPNCPEETLTREFLLSGYKETIDGIEESKESALSLVGSLSRPIILKCKESIRRLLRAINESRAQKRKAGQVYGVPLSGPLLTKSGGFPEQRACVEDFRKKWIEGLSQQHKQLRLLADHVPHGYRRKSLFEVLIRHNVPLLRATWFIKVTYLNQVRLGSTGISSGEADKKQATRTELWTKDVIEYMQCLLDEIFIESSLANTHGRDHLPLVGSVQHKGDSLHAIPDGAEPSLQFKWQYMVHILKWHYAEGLLLPSLIIEWVLNLLQEKDSVEALRLLLPIVFDVIESIALSQTYVRMLVDIAVRSLQELTSVSPESAEKSLRPYIAAVLVEILRYLILRVPDTFVSLDCFHLPPCVVSGAISGSNSLSKALEDADKGHYGDSFPRYLPFGHAVSLVQKRAANLSKAAGNGLQGHGVARVAQILDRALILGDVRGAYNSLFEDFCDESFAEGWIADVSPCLRSCLQWIGTASLPVICSVFFLCEWATCDFRDYRTPLPSDLEFTGRKDFSQVYIAVLLLRNKHEDLQGSSQGNALTSNFPVLRNYLKNLDRDMDLLEMFQSPSPLHDIVVLWLDQHEPSRGEGLKRVQVLVMELIRCGIFSPQAYVRQLIVSGIMDRKGTLEDSERRKRHSQILKQLPGRYLFDALEEARIAETPVLSEVVRVYSNERQLVLRGLLSGLPRNLRNGRDSAPSTSSDQWKHAYLTKSHLPVEYTKTKIHVPELKAAISVLLHLPVSCAASMDKGESQGRKRPAGLVSTKIDQAEATPGCEECQKAKRQKSSEEWSSHIQGFSSNLSDDEETWWVRKGPKSSSDLIKIEAAFKSTKPLSRGRQKTGRKTQSLAQLQAARIESSQGTSSSHVCNNKVSCPHHRTVIEGEMPKAKDGIRIIDSNDIVAIGKAMKKLRLVERWSITIWLNTVIRQLVVETEKATSKVGHDAGGPFSDERSVVRWKLGEDELSAILYLLDVSLDLFSIVKFLLWLLPKAFLGAQPIVQSGRNVLMQPQNKEGHACEVGEAFILSSLQRYENILVAADLIPEALTVVMRRAVTVMQSNGRISGSPAFSYARNLLKKYGNMASVEKWEKNFKATCDQRLLTELDATRSLDGDLGFAHVGVPAGVEDVDDYLRQKLNGRLSRAGPSMKEIVQRHVAEALPYIYGKERKLLEAAIPKGSNLEKWDDGYQTAHQIVLGLMDCIRQNGIATQDGDPYAVASAVSAIVGNVGPATMKILDLPASNNHPGSCSTITSFSQNCAQRIIHIHVSCLCLLKEYLGERYSRIFEIALAAEASSTVSGAFAPGKAPRSQFQLSPETPDTSLSTPSEILTNSTKVFLGRATKAAAAVSALVIGAIVHGVANLERMVTVFRIKEGLDFLQFMRSSRSSSNGFSRSTGGFKADNCTEVSMYWFRLLVGNCRTVSDGLVAELLGESSIVALSRMQRLLPLNLVFPSAYSIFAMVIWRPREDLYQSLSSAIGDAIRHQPFRDICLRDTCALYDLFASDTCDSEFASIMELQIPDKYSKITMAFIPLLARMFLNSILDCKMPNFVDDGSCTPVQRESRVYLENEGKLLEQLVHILDTLQPAKFHWQWVELRLILNEQVINEKIEAHNMSLKEAIRSLSHAADNSLLSESENTFTEIVLTRLLVRPDAAPLYSELVHLLGRSLEESLLQKAKWLLSGNDVLLGRMSIRQKLINLAQLRGVSTKVPFWKPWGWPNSTADPVANRGEGKKLEPYSIEEGEVVEEGNDPKKFGRQISQMFDIEGFELCQQIVTEKALVELVLPCIDRSSNESRNTFATDLIRQMSTIEQQINGLSRGTGKQVAPTVSGVEGGTSKGNARKGIRGGSPGSGRRVMGAIDSSPPSAAALRASLRLRLQFLLRLLPTICADRVSRGSSGLNMRHFLAKVILRLLGTRVVHEDVDSSYMLAQGIPSPKEEIELLETSATSLDLSGGSLFDIFLVVLHGLLSSHKPSWLKPKSTYKSNTKPLRDFTAFDRELAESMQTDLDNMVLPETIRQRLQAAMPMLPPPPPFSFSCQPPAVSTAALAPLQSGVPTGGCQPGTPSLSQRTPSYSAGPHASVSGKSKSLPSQDPDMDIDIWTLLEDGTGCGPTSSNNSLGVSGDHANLKACAWLKGAVRVRRTDLTYIGVVDDDS